MSNYRIYRTDTRNIAIQRKSGKQWKTISYHGNSPFSLISGLLNLIGSQHTPKNKELSGQLEMMRLELILGVDKLEKMINRYLNDL